MAAAQSLCVGELRVSAPEDTLGLHLRAAKVPHEREYRFAALATGGTGKGCRQRLKDAGLADWRFDFAVPDHHLAIEVEGGAWTGGRHTRGQGFAADLRKYDAAARLGWYVYRCDPAMIKSGMALETITQLIT